MFLTSNVIFEVTETPDKSEHIEPINSYRLILLYF